MCVNVDVPLEQTLPFIGMLDEVLMHRVNPVSAVPVPADGRAHPSK